jgi:hypothetical protein
MTHIVHKNFGRRCYTWREASKNYFTFWRSQKGQETTKSLWGSCRAPKGDPIRELLEPLSKDLAKFHTIKQQHNISQIMYDCGEGWQMFMLETMLYEYGERLGKFYEIITVIEDDTDAVYFKLVMG